MRKKSMSIIVPTYNRKEKIVSCIKSLLLQDYKNYEIIIINDGSLDGTLGILKKNFGDNKIIKIYSQKNGGPAKARNLGIKKSSGDIIGFTDDDCLPKKNWISEAAGLFNSKKILGVMGKTIFDGKPYLDKDKKYVGYLTCNMFYTKEAIQNTGGFDEKYPYPQREDTDLAWKILKKGEILKREEVVVIHPDYHGNKNWKFFSSDVLLQKKFPKEYLEFVKEGGVGFIKNPFNWKGIFSGEKRYKHRYPLIKVSFIEWKRYLYSKL